MFWRLLHESLGFRIGASGLGCIWLGLWPSEDMKFPFKRWTTGSTCSVTVEYGSLL